MTKLRRSPAVGRFAKPCRHEAVRPSGQALNRRAEYFIINSKVQPRCSELPAFNDVLVYRMAKDEILLLPMSVDQSNDPAFIQDREEVLGPCSILARF